MLIGINIINMNILQTTPSSVSLLSSGPSSNNPQTPLTMPSMNPSSQQIGTPVTPQQAPSSVQTSASTVESNSGGLSIVPPDPISLAKNLILKDLRYSLIVRFILLFWSYLFTTCLKFAIAMYKTLVDGKKNLFFAIKVFAILILAL